MEDTMVPGLMDQSLMPFSTAENWD